MSLAEIHIEIPKAEAVAIEYPGFVRDINKVLSTLGGIDSIATAVGTRHYLKLKLRPEDRSSHPLYGERIEQTRLLLRIARPRQPCDGQSTNTATSSAGVFTGNEAEPMEATSATGGAGDTAGVTASIVARVTPTFRFPGLADYAFIPHDPVLASRTREHLPYDQRPDRAEPTKSMQPFLLIPQLFSWLDLPQDYSFKQVQTKHHLRANARSEPSWGEAPVISFYAEGVPPPVASTSVGAAAAAAAAASAATTAKPTTVGANDAAGSPVPVATMAQADASIADVRAYRVLEAEVSRLLAQRPVWGLDLMRERCAACAAVQAAMPGGCNSGAVERVVQRLCYRFKTGPWRGLFIRRGYDPRADVEARKYQALVYSLPNNWYRNMLKTGLHGGMKQQGKTATAERGPSDGGGAGEAGSAAAGATGVLNSGHNSPGVGASASPGAGGGDSREGAGGFAAAKATTATTTWSPLAPSCLDDLHKFRALPTQQSVTFQLVDLQLTEVQEALQEGPPSADASRCSEKTGWFVNAMLQRMQAAVQQRFLQLMERMAPPGVGLGVTGDLPSSGGMEAAAAAAAGGGGAPNTRVAGAAGAGRRGGEAATAGQTSAAAASDGGDGDVEMLDATAAEETRAVQQGFDGAAAAAAATRGRGGSGGGAAAAAAAADGALRALMAQMNLRGLSTASGDNDDVGVAGLFGSDDEGDDFQLLDAHEDQDDVDGRAMGFAEDYEANASTQRRNAGRPGADSSGSRGDDGDDGGGGGSGGGGGVATSRQGRDALRDVEDADDSAIESEYDIGMGDEDEEDDEGDEDVNDNDLQEEEEEGDGPGRVRRLSSLAGQLYGDGTYGRVTVPFDGGMWDRRHDGGGGMFGSEDDDEPY